MGTNGEISEFSWPQEELLRETSWQGWLKDRERCELLRKLVTAARLHGYQLGEHIIGGVSILSPVFMEKLMSEGYLLREELRGRIDLPRANSEPQFDRSARP